MFLYLFFLLQDISFATNNHKHNNHTNKHSHDEKNMPGLKGINTTEKEENDLKTINESNNSRLRSAIIDHVSMMVTRLEEGKNPKVFIQTPILDRLFEFYDVINTELEVTEKGIIVIQTSNNEKVVKLLQIHADEVSDMSKRGMIAVHQRIMKKYNKH